MFRSILLVLSLCLTAPAFAQSDADRAAAEALIDQFDVDTRANNVEGIISIMPPPIMAIMSASFGMEIPDLRRSMAQQMENLLAQVVIDDFSMDLDGARGGVTSTGRPYFVVETQTTMSVIGAGRVRATSDTLAFEDGGAWWLMRVENAYHEQVMAQAFPDLADVEFAPGTLEEIR